MAGVGVAVNAVRERTVDVRYGRPQTRELRVSEENRPRRRRDLRREAMHYLVDQRQAGDRRLIRKEKWIGDRSADHERLAGFDDPGASDRARNKQQRDTEQRQRQHMVE